MSKDRYVIRLAVVNGEAVKSTLVSVGKAGEKSMNQLAQASNKAGKGMSWIAPMARGLGVLSATIGAVAGATAGAFLAATKSTLQYAEDLKSMATNANTTASALQELAFVGRQWGMTTEDISAVMNELTKRAQEFASLGSGPAVDAFKALGYSQTEVNGLLGDTDVLMQDLIKRVSEFDRSSQIQLGDQLFGGSGDNFIRVLALGSDEIARLRQEAQSLGIVMSDELVASSAAANQKLELLGDVLSKKVAVALAENSEKILQLTEVILNNLPGAIDSVLRLADAFGLVDNEVSSNVNNATKSLSGLRGELDRLNQQMAQTPEFAKGPRQRIQGEIDRVQEEISGRTTTNSGSAASVPGSSIKPTPKKSLPVVIKPDGKSSQIAERLREMKAEISLVQMSAREQAIETGVRRLGADATAAQVALAREYAGRLYDQNEAVKAAEDQSRRFEQAQSSLASTIDSTLGDALRGNLTDWEFWGDSIINIAEDVAKSLFAAQGIEGGGLGGILAGGLMSFFKGSSTATVAGTTPGRAFGGPVSAGAGYRVKEMGNEYLVSSLNGRVVPESALKSGGSVSVTVINNSPSDVSTQSEETASGTSLQIMVDQMTAQNVRGRNTMTSRAMREVQSTGTIRR